MDNEAGTTTAPKISFAELQKRSSFCGTFSLNNSCEREQRRILELVEAKETAERELREAAERYKFLKNEVGFKKQDFHHEAESQGISKELWDAYEAFCESIESQFDSEEGFCIMFDEGHKGSYVKYDPDLRFYKNFSDMDWSQRNFRCEASRSRIVDFWPVPHLGTDLEDVSTWGDLYPKLYELATEAARNGSEAAIDMLVTLPDREASFKGGWLFECFAIDQSGYGVEDIVYGHRLVWAWSPIKSIRWTYRSAHRVDSPEDAATKRNRIRAVLDHEG